MPGGAQIMNQINVNYDQMDKLKAMLLQSLPPWKRTQLETELRQVWQAQTYWAKEYHKATGLGMIVFEAWG